MTRKEVRNYIKLSLRVYSERIMTEDEMVENIIDAVSGSSFFSYTSFIIGFLTGGLVYLIAIHFKL